MTKFATKVVHAGYSIDHTGSVMPPIYTSTTYAQAAPGQLISNYEYARAGNPTREYLETAIAKLENGKFGFAFASGSAATATLLTLLDSNSHIIAISDLYGGTHRYFEEVLRTKSGTTVTYLDKVDAVSVQAALQSNTKMIWIESPTNPMLNLVDLAQIADIAKQYNLISVADNTFASPYIQQPLNFGFDIVLHSATKYINGHSDVVAGLAVVSDAALAEKIAFYQNTIGAVLDPISSFLILRGIRTLALRLKQHCSNALKIANVLERSNLVAAVYYPGLASHPQHQLAKQQMNGFGGVVTIRLKQQDEAEIAALINKLNIFVLAESLGGVESLVCQPYSMTHAAIPLAKRLQLGLTPSLLRLSIGIEDADDLIADLLQALAN